MKMFFSLQNLHVNLHELKINVYEVLYGCFPLNCYFIKRNNKKATMTFDSSNF